VLGRERKRALRSTAGVPRSSSDRFHNVGRCIPESAIATIFEPMVRHSGDGHTNTGVGLGLYIASQIALAHGGKLDVTSTEVDGTRFTLRLPRQVPSQKVQRGPGAP
jgi:K+-sensing histidine kinase KdpD